MTKADYLSQIRDRIKGIPADEVEKHIEYYSEMIDDRIEEGIPEEEAVAGMDTPKAVADMILQETPLSKLVEDKINSKRQFNTFELILIVLGSPVWLSLLIAAFSLVLALFITVFALVISYYAVGLAVGASGIVGIIGTVLFIVVLNVKASVFMLGVSLVCIGLLILFFMSVKPVTVAIVRFWAWICQLVKRVFAGSKNS